MFDPKHLVHRYTRTQAINDGVLIDVSDMSKDAGIKYETAVTRAVWERCVTVPPGVDCQDESGRLWDVLWLLRCAVLRGADGPVIHFAVRVRNTNDDGIPPLVTLKAHCGPGDNAEPVITILLPEED
jgi:hypothetical protein